MALITYQNVRPWARAIKNKVVAHEMPPWGASPASMKIANDRSLSQKDIETIVRWADGGVPKGDDKDLPAVPTFPAGGWAFGQPDAVIDLPIEVQVPPTGEFPQTSYFVKSPFPTDVWIQKMQVRTSNPAIVHHATLFIRQMPEGTVLKDGRPVVDGVRTEGERDGLNLQAGLPPGSGPGIRLVSYVPGRGWEAYADGVARRLPKGAYIEMNMHYQPSGKPEKERAQFGIWFSKAPVHYEMQNVSTLDRGTTMVDDKPLPSDRIPNIPPGVDNWKITNFKIFPEPATLYAHVAAHAPARQGHEVHPHVSGRPRAAGTRRAEVRFQLAAVLRTRDAAEDSGRQQADRDRALRQLAEEQVEPRAGQRSVLVGAELGRDVQPADPVDVGSAGSDQEVASRFSRTAAGPERAGLTYATSAGQPFQGRPVEHRLTA